MRERLERRYRLLLLAYPRRYRRHRGIEMLTTLMDVAPEDRTRPTVSDVVSILFGGLRCRLSRGGAPLSVSVAIAVICATLGAAAASLLGWQSARDLPDDATAAALARAAVPQLPDVSDERREYLFGYAIPVRPDERVLVALFGGEDYAPGHVSFGSGSPIDQRSARDRLIAHGWQTEVVNEGELTAHRDGFFLRVGPSSVLVERAAPPIVPFLTVAGLLLGGLAGWRLSAWAGRRAARLRVWRGYAAGTVFALGMTFLAPPLAINLLVIGFALASPAAPIPGWIGFVAAVMAGLVRMGLVMVLIAALILGLPGRERVRHLVT